MYVKLKSNSVLQSLGGSIKRNKIAATLVGAGIGASLVVGGNVLITTSREMFDRILKMFQRDLEELASIIKGMDQNDVGTYYPVLKLIKIQQGLVNGAITTKGILDSDGNVDVASLLTAFYTEIAPIITDRKSIIDGLASKKTSSFANATSIISRVRIIIVAEDTTLEAEFKKYKVAANQAKQMVDTKLVNAKIEDPKIEATKTQIEKVGEVVDKKINNSVGDKFWNFLKTPSAGRSVVILFGGAAIAYGIWKVAQKIHSYYKQWRDKDSEKEASEETNGETPTGQPYTV